MFSSRLRRSSLWPSISVCSSEHKTLIRRESDTDRYDIAVLNSCDQIASEFLLIDEANLSDGYQRLDKWLGQITTTYRIVMLVTSAQSQDATTALQELQLRIMDSDNFVPVLLVPGGEQVLPIVKAFQINDNLQSIPNITRPSKETVMAYCTSSAPQKLLTDHEVQTIHRICGSIEGLEKATRTMEGKTLLYQHLSAETVQDLIKFWKDEWIL